MSQLGTLADRILDVPRGYASGFDSPAALLDRLFEHPAQCPLSPFPSFDIPNTATQSRRRRVTFPSKTTLLTRCSFTRSIRP